MMGGKIPIIMAGWKWLLFDGAIAHMVPNELVDVIVADMESRGCPLTEEREGMSLALDQPGMICVDRPIEEFELMGLDMEIPSEDVLSFLSELSALQLRGGCYYKLHGFMRCIVLGQRQRDAMLAQLTSLYEGAEVRAMEFYADRKLPSQVLREANAKATGRSADEMPNFGANKQDRFKPKGSGTPN